MTEAGITKGQSDQGRMLPAGEARFVGRRGELEALYNAIRDTVNQGRLHRLLIEGAAGTGKTRLVNEFLNIVEVGRRGIGLHWVQVSEGDADTPEHVLAPLEDIPRVESPVIVLIDGAHWLGEECVAALENWIQQHEDKPVLLGLLTRKAMQDRLRGTWNRFEMGSMTEELLARIAREHLSAVENLPESMVAMLAEQAAGIPRLVEDLIRVLVSRGVLTPSGEGKWEANEDELTRAPLPGTLGESSAVRIQGLTRVQRRVLQRASVFGTVFWFEGVLRLLRTDTEIHSPWNSDEEAAALRELLEGLVGDGMVCEVPVPTLAGHQEFEFRRALDRRSLFRTLDDDERRMFQRVAGGWLAEVAPAEDDGHWLDQSAELLERGGAARRAAEVLSTAADSALKHHHLARGVDRLERAIEGLDLDDVDVLLRLEERASGLLLRAGRAKRARRHVERWLVLTHLARDHRGGCDAWIRLSRAQCLLARYEDAEEAIVKAGEMIGSHELSEFSGALARTEALLGIWRGDDGAWETAALSATGALEQGRRGGDPWAVARALLDLGHVYLHQMKLADSEARFREAMGVLEPLDEQRGYARALLGLGKIASAEGRAGIAVEHWSRALRMVDAVGDAPQMIALLIELGRHALEMRDGEQAHSFVMEAFGIAQRNGLEAHLAILYAERASVTSLLKRREEVPALLSEGLGLAKSLGSARAVACMRAVSGVLTVQKSDGEVAMAEFERMGDLMELRRVSRFLER